MIDNQDDYASALLLSRSEPPNLRDAYALLKRASDSGDDRAIYAIATWYLFGNDVVDEDQKKGILMLESLQNSFVAEALYDLAVSYDYGRYVEQSDHKAFSFYMRAAILGDRESCSQIAQFYAEGDIVERDDALSKAWKKRSEQDEHDISPPYRLWIDSRIG